MPLARLARHLIRKGRLTLTDASGTVHRCEGAEPGPQAAMRITDKAWEWRILRNPYLAFGEAYMAGALIPEDGDIGDVIAVVMANTRHLQAHAFYRFTTRLRFLTRRLAQHNPAARARKNVAHHYDLSAELYDTFLDEERFYSCGYFRPGVDDLDRSQADKARHLAAKLLLEPGQRVLDIGAGWGGLAIHLARLGASKVDGITLSEEQLNWGRDRVRREGLQDQIDLRLQDYRDVTGQYDRIVSVGMFEHVGIGHYEQYFNAVRDRLSDDGVAVIHSIGKSGPPGITNPWIAKYIFPGGYIPSLSEVLPAIERSGLKVTDIEVLRLHYAETLRHWRQRFAARRAEIAELYDERFCRMWEFYLAGSEMSFRVGETMVFQLQLAKRHGVVPITRDYITHFDEADSARDAEKPRLVSMGQAE